MGNPANPANFADRRRKRMDRVDGMAADLRACVHEFGLTIVDAFLSQGVNNPKSIRHIIQAIRYGAVDLGSPEHGSAMLKLRAPR